MNRDLLSAVLGRQVWPRALAPAVLRGYRRRSVRGASYPVALRQRGASVAGVILCGVSTAETARLCAYEGDGYELACALAESAGPRRKHVFLFKPRPGAYSFSTRPWSLPGWRLRFKRLEMKAMTVGWVEQKSETRR
jgi:hypothetical protein